MGKGKNIYLIWFFIFILSFIIALPVAAAEQRNNEAIVGIDQDLYSRLINFVVEHDQALSAREEVLKVALKLKKARTNGENGVSEYVQNSLQQKELESVVRIQEAQTKYVEARRELITQLTQKITEIFTLQNRIKNQQELHKILAERRDSTRGQVESGQVDAEVLKDLSEKIISIQTVIADAEVKIQMLKYEIAFNYGGNDWQQLLELLQRLETNS